MSDWGWYRNPKPRKPKHGLQAKSQRGAFGQSWWAKRWIGVLEAFGWENRMQRGRSYARHGLVIGLDVKPGLVSARVQGSMRTPYKVQITLPPLSDPQWEKAIDAMSEQAIFAAQLLAGEMPQDIETAFEAAGVPLFPKRGRDLETHCSCPDFANPCKHIAAVYYLLGEQFDADPFLLFRLRGRTREQVMQALRQRRAAASAELPEAAPVVEAGPSGPALSEQLEHFYAAGAALDEIAAHIAAPDVELAPLRRLGTPPAGAGPELEQIYPALTAYVLKQVFGD